MAEVCAIGQVCTTKQEAALASEVVASLFINDDACGDWVIPLGRGGLSFQSVNAMSALLFVAAGAPLVCRAESPIARAYGLMMCGVGLGSFSFHGTSALSAFLIDIVPMAVTAALMLFKAIHVVQVDAGRVGKTAESARFFISMSAAVFAVYTPWMMIVAGVSHFTVWGVWALLFGSMGAIFGVVALAVFVNENVLFSRSGADLFIAIACVLMGLGCTIHSFIPGLCEGWRAALPLHAFWHLFSSITANRCGCVLDTVTKLVDAQEKNPPKRKSGDSLLVRLIKNDALPSQFSM